MILRVKATPNSSQNKILGWDDDPLVGPVLRVKIKSPPIDGKANKALIAFLSKSLQLPMSSIRLTKGAHSRIKSLEIPDNTKISIDS